MYSLPITERQATLGVLGLQVIAGIAVLLISAIAQNVSLIGFAVVGTLIPGSIFFGYWRGWDWMRYVAVAFSVLLSVAVLVFDAQSRGEFSPVLFMPAVLALIMAGPLTIAGAGVVTLIATNLFLLDLRPNPYADVITILVSAVILGGMVLAKMVVQTALNIAQNNARRAEEARIEAAKQASIAEQRSADFEARNAEQQRLLDLVAELEIPVISLAAGTLLAPVVGTLDTRRVTALTDRLLGAVAAQRARLVILDIAGVSLVDTGVAQGLLKIAQAIRLLGCDVTITGISAEVAQTLSHLGVELKGLATARSPEDALQQVQKFSIGN